MGAKHLVWWIPIGALALALIELPYGYYVLLRIVVCGACAFLAFAEDESGRKRWAWALGMVAVLYNPIFPIHLNRGLWIVINFATIWFFAIHMWSRGRPNANGASQ